MHWYSRQCGYYLLLKYREILSIFFRKAIKKLLYPTGLRGICEASKCRRIFVLVLPWSLTSWPLNWLFHALAMWITCATLHQNWFVRFQNTVFTSLATDEQMNDRTNEQVKNITPPPASVARWRRTCCCTSSDLYNNKNSNNSNK